MALGWRPTKGLHLVVFDLDEWSQRHGNVSWWQFDSIEFRKRPTTEVIDTIEGYGYGMMAAYLDMVIFAK